MRPIVAVVAGFGLLSFTACSETPQEPVVADKAPVSTQPEPGSPTGHVVHVQVDDEAEGPHETAGDGHTTKSGHDGQHQSHGRRGSHGHKAGGHGHSGEQQAGDDSKRIAVGDKVPEFEVTIDGKKFKLSELRKNTALTEDGTLVLTFWCSFCHSCRHVEHQLDKLAKQYKGQVGVIALDASAGETAEIVAEFATEQKLTMPIALNASGTAADIFGARVTTTTIVIDSQGVLRYCGRFADRQHAFAEDALKEVLAGEEVRVKKTRHKG